MPIYFRRDIKAPIIIQVSQGDDAYFAGKGSQTTTNKLPFY